MAEMWGTGARAGVLIKPRAISRNARVAVLAASSPSEPQRIQEAAVRLEERGLRVTLADNIGHRHRNYLAGSDDERAAQLNHYFRSPEFDAFFFARGGYGAARILEQLDYAAFAANPRPLIGFSDVTALHQAIAVSAGVATFHGPMVNLDFFEGLSPDIEEWFWAVLGGWDHLQWTFEPGDVVVEGEAEGTLFGGCLSITGSLVGTPYDYWVDDGIWFWEDVEEPAYRLDRLLTQFRLSGRMQRLRGVIVGKLKGCASDEEIVALLTDFFGASGIPVIRNLPFGHHGNNLIMPIGRTVRLSTSRRTFSLAEPAVERR